MYRESSHVPKLWIQVPVFRCQVSERNEKVKGHGPSVWDMAVFGKAYAVALDAHKLSLGFPRIEQFELASQLRRE